MKTKHSTAAARAHKFPLRVSMSALAMSIAVMTGALPEPALAQSTNVQFSIPAQSLSRALLQLGEQASLQIFFSQDIVDGYTAPAVSGSLPPEETLRRLLAGTGIEFRRTGNNVSLSKSLTTTELAPVVVTGQRDALTTEGSGSYAARGASIMKGAESLKDIPQSVSVITSQRMEDQNLTSLRDVMEQAPGVFSNSGSAGVAATDTTSGYWSRGFQINSYMVDGVAADAADPWVWQMSSGLDGGSAIYDRVEILRGAAGLLVGQGTPGGTVNLVRKRPTKDFQQNYTLAIGSWDNYRGEADISGSLNTSGSVRGRVVASYQDRGRYYGTQKSKTPLFYGIVEADISSATRASLGVSYEKSDTDSPRMQNFHGWWNTNFKPDRKRFYGPKWGYADIEDKKVFLDFKHDFNDKWQLNVAASHAQRSYEGVLPTVEVVWDGYLLARAEESKTNSIDVNLVGGFDAFGQEHKLTFGANSSRKKSDWMGQYTYDLFAFDDISDLEAGVDWPYDASMGSAVEALFSRGRNNTKSKSQGVFGKLDFKVTDKLTAILGGRLSWYEFDFTFGDGRGYAPARSGKVSSEFTPYAGLLYALSPQWSAYASYADIFNPQWGTYTRDGSLIDHEVGKSYELGIKGELLDGRLNTALAIYQGDLENSAMLEAPPFDQACPGNPIGGGCSIAMGKKRTRGIDAEINGELLPGWQVGAGYTYTHTRVLRTNPSNVEMYYRLTPKHMFKLFSSYAVNEKLTVGGGVQALSSEVAVNDSPVQPGYALWNAFARYRINKNLDASLNVTNIFDRTYFLNGSAPYAGAWGEPRSFMLTLRGRF